MTSVARLLILIGIQIILTFVAAWVVTRSIREALKGLKVALKSELTSNVGRLNLIAMILFVFVMFVFNLHEMVANALSVESAAKNTDHVLGPAALIGLFFMGSLICVMIVEKDK